EEPAAGGPVQQRGRQLAEQPRGGLVPPGVLAVPSGGPVQRDQHGQGPGPGGEGELDQGRQDDPLVPPPPGGVALGRADGVAGAPLAEDRRAAVPVDGVAARQGDRLAGGEPAEGDARQGAGQRPEGPAPPGEDAVVAGGMTGGQAAKGAQQVGDG